MQTRTRNRQMIFRLTEKEFETIEIKFKTSGITNRSDFLLKCTNDKPLVVINNISEAMNELIRQGNNLNQIAYTLNSGKFPNTQQLSETLTKCNKTYEKLLEIQKNIQARYKRPRRRAGMNATSEEN